MASNKPPDSKESKLILAAGAVAWLPGRDGGDPYVLLVHLKKYVVWCLPIGKTDFGETLRVCALRFFLVVGGAVLIIGRRMS
jgi:8-oxo-dGTP pyrophosphatase MutT (NUDIX family)